MLLRIRYILVVLLFAAVGTLCRMQVARPAGSFGGETLLVQHTATHDCDASRYCGHTLLASDVQCEVHSQNPDQKILAKSAAIPGRGHSKTDEGSVSDISGQNAALPHPTAKEYYIFSQGKIRI